jgi:prepilin-type N-terminal cleavage/methylation domain-containing protein
MNRIKRPDGFSLIEVLAGLSIFAVVSAGLAATTISTVRANSTSRELTAASALIHSKIEDFRALDPAGNPDDLTAGTHNDASNPITPLGAAGGEFRRSWVVTTNTPKGGMSRIVVSVTFNNPDSYTMTGVTYVCRTSTCK